MGWKRSKGLKLQPIKAKQEKEDAPEIHRGPESQRTCHLEQLLRVPANYLTHQCNFEWQETSHFLKYNPKRLYCL